MDRSDGTHVAVGSAFLGVGGVGLSIMIPLAAAANPHPWTAVWFLIPACVAGVLGLMGFYILAAVYTGWRLPSTASERAAAPDLRVESVAILNVYEGASGPQVVFQVGIANDGRGDVTNASVNVCVPLLVRELIRSDDSGGRLGVGADLVGAIAATDKVRYWNIAGQTFSGRTSYVLPFRAGMGTAERFAVDVKIVSVDLDHPVKASVVLDPAAHASDVVEGQEPAP